ncbi:MAG: hypothetical protein KDC80_00135 [Saprospiraceae bacterium]|nr:hypothetical protein [Saprospiraceae bacterium]
MDYCFQKSLQTVTALTLAFSSFLMVSSAKSLPSPYGLTCEFLRDPSDAVVTDSTPEFNWIFPQEGVSQYAFQVLVASSIRDLNPANADLWNSGRVVSSNSTNISYAGKKLMSHTSIWWQVRVWSENGDSSGYAVPQIVYLGDFDRSNLDYPGQSRWVELAKDHFVAEDRQCAHFFEIEPSSVKVNEKGNYFIEFAKAAFGTLQFYASTGMDDQKVTVFLGERRKGEEVHKDPGVSNIGFVQVSLELKKGLHMYTVKLPERPPSRYLHSQRLATHYAEVSPFRYAEIRIDPNQVEITAVRQLALFYYCDDNASEFQCSDDRLQAVWNLSKYTLKATPFLGVYADGNRERMPYEADAYIQQLSHYAVDREYAIGRYTIDFLFDHASWPTEWQMHMVLMTWQHYMYTGDLELLEERYADLKRKSLYQLTEENDLISSRGGKKTRAFLDSLNFPGNVSQFRDIVDWPQGPTPGEAAQSHQSPVPGGETDGYVFTDFNTVVNAFHNRCLHIMAEMARLTGRQADHEFFLDLARKHGTAFLESFFDAERGIFTDGVSTDHASLHANMFALAFDLVPEKYLSQVVAFIESRGMACSVYGAQYLLEALFNVNEAQYAIDLLTSDGKRSWLNMIENGATMTTEAWDEYFKPNLTWNHAWGASPANIMVRKMFGIEPLEPAFKSFQIKPQPGDLEYMSVKTPTIRGEIACELTTGNSHWEMLISVPGNTKAFVRLPQAFDRVLLNGQLISRPDSNGEDIGLPAGIHKLICDRN